MRNPYEQRTYDVKCSVCGKKFKAKRTNAAYCSDLCRNKERRQRQKAKSKDPANALYLTGKTAGCKGCYCWGGNCCDYIGVYDHCRSAPIGPNGGCDLYRPTWEQGVTEAAKRCWSVDKAEKLWPEGVNYNALPRPEMERLTRELAKKLKCTPNSVKAWLNHKEVQRSDGNAVGADQATECGRKV